MSQGLRMKCSMGTVLIAVAFGALPAPAGAADQIVVQGSDARAIIDPAPFRITFTDGDGRAVLRQVAPPAAPSISANLEPEPGGADNLPELTSYAPLSFEVGGERGLQWHHLLHQGNMLASARAGLIHHATEVLSAVPEDGGWKLEVATTDPLRTMTVRVTPDLGTGIRVRAALSQAAGVTAFGDSFESGEDEAFHGFGGRANAVDQRGQDFYSWVEQEELGQGPCEPVCKYIPGGQGDKYTLPNGPHASYYVQNIMLSSRPYGMLVNQTELTRWRLASDRPDAWQVAAHSATLDYTVAVGEARRAISTLTAINGVHEVAPRWAMEPGLKRNVQILGGGSCDADCYEAKIRADLKRIDELDLEGQLGSFSYEGWGTIFYGSPEGPDRVRAINAEIRRLGMHPMGYQRAFITDDGFDTTAQWEAARSNGYCVRAAAPDGPAYIYISTRPTCVFDVTNPEARAWWTQRLRDMLDAGFDGFMNDFGEQIVQDMVFHDGRTGKEMHNQYPTEFHKFTREVVEAWEEENPDRGEVFFYSRAGFSGRRGSAAYESGNFPGDETTDWNRGTGLPSLTTDMLSRGIGGAVGFTTGIGGYFDSYWDDLTEELFIRWSQWTALTPIYRLHNSCCSTGTRMPWSWEGGEQADGYKAWKAAGDLHVWALPLLRELWEEAAQTGMPIAQPLYLHYPEDRRAHSEEQAWMLGPDVLVAPVVAKGAAARTTYLPAGCWELQEGPDAGTQYQGGQDVTVAAPLLTLPYFFRCGSAPF